MKFGFDKIQQMPAYQFAMSLPNSRLVNVIGRACHDVSAVIVGYVATCATFEAVYQVANAGLPGKPLYRFILSGSSLLNNYLPLGAVMKAIEVGTHDVMPSLPTVVKAVALAGAFSFATYSLAGGLKEDVNSLCSWGFTPAPPPKPKKG